MCILIEIEWIPRSHIMSTVLQTIHANLSAELSIYVKTGRRQLAITPTDTDYTRKPQLAMSHPNNILSIQPANTTPSSVPNIIMSRLARLRQLMSRPIITHVSIRPSMLLTLLLVLCTRNPGKSICICSPHPTWAAIQLRARDLQLSAHQIIANRYPKSQ